MSPRFHLKLSITAAILVNALLAIIWTTFLVNLSSYSYHCGTFLLNLEILMQNFSLVSFLILLWAFSSYRSVQATITPQFRFLVRLPLCVLVALNLGYWAVGFIMPRL